ncbi:MAG: hypothetical protein L0332_11780 [Chloroflexi bacterium]|nr:hypothetical protein [Chloroflexota bacterium]MCI0580185.1 hypothetical protein [Chloroflexota bacterium]MCI0646047.1 hypothetical protein [Chloroflexota bacterium]MCI0727389.1 hypothetical protein [Chloroflexota bacterium]
MGSEKTKTITQVYEGGDLVIPGSLLESLGIQPGDTVVVRPQLSIASLSPEEKRQRREILNRLAEAWEEEDLANFEQQREQMWQQWTMRNS